MSLKNRQTALGIAAKLPVADLLPLLARSASAQRASERQFDGPNTHTQDCNCAKSALASHCAESRLRFELEEENTRLREVIAQLAGSISSHKSDRYAAD